MNLRKHKIGVEIARHLSKIFINMFPGVLISVVKVEVTDNLGSAHIFLSIYDKYSQQILKKVVNKSSKIRSIVSSKLKIRRIPTFFFILDDTIEYSQRISNIVKELKEERDELQAKIS